MNELSLPNRMYLLAYDPAKQRLVARGGLGLVLRAAALTELYLRGHLTDADGRVQVAPGAPATDDLIREIRESKPRRWRSWVERGERAMTRVVRDQLDDARLIRVEPRRILGVFPSTRITVRDTRIVARLRTTVDRTLREGTLTSHVEPVDAAVVALAATGELRALISRQRAREHKQRITALAALAGPAIPALEKAIATRRAAGAG